MKILAGILAALVALPLIVLITWYNTYNGLVSSDERVSQTYSQVQNVMQRQADLIPNLVETVKGYASHENKTLVAVTEARGKLTAVAKMKPEELAANPELQKQLIEAQAQMGNALGGLQATFTREAYPQLQANSNFQSLMAELAGSQNRITVERQRNQVAVRKYNVQVRTAISGMVARHHGFQPKPYFGASEQGRATPTVKF